MQRRRLFISAQSLQGFSIISIYGHRASTARHAARPCRAGTARLRASRVTVPTRVVPGRAMGQAIGPRHGTRAKFPCRAAHGARPMCPCRAAQWPGRFDMNYQTTNK
jgi:hypothetical protein